MSAYILKLIAIITMTIDHSSYLIYGANLSWMNYIGRIAFPIFAFQISEGYTHTKNLKKYFARLILFALISEIPYAWFSYMFFSGVKLNIIFTLIVGLLAIYIYDLLVQKGNKESKESKENKESTSSYKLLGVMFAIFLGLLADGLGLDYGFYGVFLIFTFYTLRNNTMLRNLGVIILTFIYYLPTLMVTNFSLSIIVLALFTLIPLIFINMYKGEKGKNFKLLFYVFYPMHLFVLCLIFYILRFFL